MLQRIEHQNDSPGQDPQHAQPNVPNTGNRDVLFHMLAISLWAFRSLTPSVAQRATRRIGQVANPTVGQLADSAVDKTRDAAYNRPYLRGKVRLVV